MHLPWYSEKGRCLSGHIDLRFLDEHFCDDNAGRNIVDNANAYMGVLGSKEVGPVIGAVHQAHMRNKDIACFGQIFAPPEETDIICPEHIKGSAVGWRFMGKVIIIHDILALEAGQAS